RILSELRLAALGLLDVSQLQVGDAPDRACVIERRAKRTPHRTCEQVSRLLQGMLEVAARHADEGVAAAQRVTEIRQRQARDEGVQPEAELCKLDGHGVEVHAVDAALEDQA